MQLRRGCRLWWVALPAIAVDRICKVAITRAMVPGEVQSVLPGVLSWAYTRNRGVAFGLLSGAAVLPLLAAKMAPGGVVLCETEREAELPEQAGALTLVKQYNYGKIKVSRYERGEEA